MTGKDAYYFTHDANARNDPKILAMRSKYGAEGYGWWWMLIEILREQENYMLPVNEFTYQILSMQLGCTVEQVKSFTKSCTGEFRDESGALLYMDDKYIWSESLLRRMEVFEMRKEKARVSAYQRWYPQRNANALLPLNERKALAMQVNYSKYSTVNNSKVNNSKLEDITLCKNIWSKTLEILKTKISEANYRTWLADTEALGRDDHFFIIHCPRYFQAEYLLRSQKSLIENCLYQAGMPDVEISFNWEMKGERL